jgi:hypothetical protein
MVPSPIIAAKDTGSSRNGLERNNLLTRDETIIDLI